MKLKPVQTYTDVSLKGRVPGELHAALIAYATYYRETIGQPIEVSPLVMQMLRDSSRRMASSRRGGGGCRTGPGRDRSRAEDAKGRKTREEDKDGTAR